MCRNGAEKGLPLSAPCVNITILKRKGVIILFTITFILPNGSVRNASAETGELLLDVARRAGVDIDAPCNGNAICGKCRVRIAAGSVEASPHRHLSQVDWEAGYRLACASTVCADATVEVPDSAAAFRSGIRTADLSDPRTREQFDRALSSLDELNCGLCIVPVAMTQPTLEDPRPDVERLNDALLAIGFENISISGYALQQLARVLRASDFAVDCIMTDDGRVIAVQPRDHARLLGVAIDIGTTTVAAALADLRTGELLACASAGNAQIRYGADVINRIIATTRPGGVERLRQAVVDDTINPLLGQLCAQAKIERTEILRVVLAGNTTMNHLLMGVDADPIRLEPYVPTFFHLPVLRASELQLKVHPDAACHIAPNVGSYVGGDITAGLLATPLWKNETCSLFLDLGTNGELVFGNSEFLLTCACSAGPAFEGGEISCGMRATNGAIDSVQISTETLEPTWTVIGDGEPTGLCGSGLIDLIAELFRTGILDSRGRFRADSRVAHDEHGLGRYILREATADTTELSLTEVDIDSFIRAKGAIFSAIRTMLAASGFTPEDIDAVYVAGGIGSGINMDSAVRIGMLPDIPRENFHYVGNTSLSGAYSMLLSQNAAEQVEALGSNMTYLELSAEPGYMDEFVASCFLPHTDVSLFPTVV